MADSTAQHATDTFRLTVDYSRPLAEAVAAGYYSFAHPDITEENFPTVKGDAEVVGNPTGVQVTPVVLLHPNRHTESDDVLGVLARMGLRPGTMFELAHFGEQHPKVQCQFPVVAFGSVWANPLGRREIGYLWGGISTGGLTSFRTTTGVVRAAAAWPSASNALLALGCSVLHYP